MIRNKQITEELLKEKTRILETMMKQYEMSLTEKQYGEYLKNLLQYAGYDNPVSLATLNKDEEIEIFINFVKNDQIYY